MVKILVNGLKPEEHMFQESLIEIGQAAAEKLEKMVEFSPEDELHLQIKSHVDGKKKRFEVKARISVKGTVYSVSEPNTDQHRDEWDLHIAVRDVLEELKKVVEKHRHKHPSGI